MLGQCRVNSGFERHLDGGGAYGQSGLWHDGCSMSPRRRSDRPIHRIAILSARPDLYSTPRLTTEAEAAGFTCIVLDHRRITLGIDLVSQIIYEGQPVDVDAIVPRVGPRSTRYGAAVVRQFEAAGVRSTISAGSILKARDKLACLQALAAAGVPVVPTSAGRTPAGLGEVLDLVGGTPVVVKLVEGTGGNGVVLAETRKAAESLLAAFHQLRAEFLVQPFVKEAGGADLRVFVIGRKVVAAMERRAAAGEFRANLHQGGAGMAVKLSRKERSVAVRAAAAVGVAVAGVDLLRTKDGPRVLEVNVSPGLEGIERASGINVAAAIIAHAANLEVIPRALPVGFVAPIGATLEFFPPEPEQ